MKTWIALTLTLITSGAAAFAEGNSDVTPEQKARIKAQMESLQKSKANAAASDNKAVKEQALRQGAAINKKAEQAKDRVNNAVDSMSWYYGHGASSAVGAAKKQQIDAEAAAQKAKIAAEAKARAAARNAAAAKSAQNIRDSVDGLKSQVSKNGQYGLKVEGTNLHVRNYGK